MIRVMVNPKPVPGTLVFGRKLEYPNKNVCAVQPTIIIVSDHHCASFMIHLSFVHHLFHLLFIIIYSSSSICLPCLPCSQNTPSYLAATLHCLISRVIHHHWQVSWVELWVVLLSQSFKLGRGLKRLHQHKAAGLGWHQSQISVSFYCPVGACVWQKSLIFGHSFWFQYQEGTNLNYT